MEKRARGKGHIARRVTAFLLAVAMVFSVVYLNGRKEVSEADYAITDDAFLEQFKDELISPTGVAHMEVMLPSDATFTQTLSLSLKLPEPGENYAWYKQGAEPSASADVLTDGTRVTRITSDEGHVALYHVVPGVAPAADDDPETPDVDETIGVNAVAEKVREIHFAQMKVSEMEDSAVVKDGKIEVSYSGFDDQRIECVHNPGTPNEYPGVDYNYGSVMYAYDTENPDTEKADADITEWKSRSEIQTAVNQAGNAYDGDYRIYKKIVLPDTANTVWMFSSAKFTRDFYMNITDVSISADGESGSYDSSSKALSIDKVAPKADVEIAFTTTDDTLSSIKAVNDADSTEEYTAAAGEKTLTITGDEANEGLTKNFTITVECTGKKTETYTASITYVVAKPKIENVRVAIQGVDAAKASDDKYYINKDDNDVKIKADVKVEGQNVNLSSIELQDATSGDVLATKTVGGTEAHPEFLIPGDLPSGLPVGDSSYKICVKTDKQGEILSDAIDIFYDVAIPSYGTVEASQTAKGVDYDQTSDTDGVFPDLFTTKQPITLVTTVVDKTNPVTPQSGVSYVKLFIGEDANNLTVEESVSFDNTLGTATSTIPADHLSNYQGKTIYAKFIAYDYAGNPAEQLLTLTFSEDEVHITKEFVEPETQLNNEDATNVGAFSVKYTLVTDMPLYKATFDAKEDGTSLAQVVYSQTDPELTAKSYADGFYTYEILIPISRTTSVEYTDLILAAETVMGATSQNQIQAIRIDLIGGEFSFADPEIENRIANGEYFHDLVLKVNFSEQKTDDTNPNEYRSGFFKKYDRSIPPAEMKGIDEVTSYVLADDQMTGMAALLISSSTDKAGTEVSFNLYDKVGNVATFGPIMIHVDGSLPKTKDMKAVSGTYVVTEGAKGNKRLLPGDPILSFTTTDNIQVVKVDATIAKPDKSKVDIASFLTDCNLPATKLSQLLGEKAADGTYKLTLDIYDQMILDNLSTQDPVEQSLTFIVDNTPPEVSVDFADSSIIRNGKYTNEETVKVILYADDAYLDDSSLVVADNGVKKGVSWEESPAGGMTAELDIAGEGTHKITLYAKDRVGNDNITSPLTFVIDTTDPVVTTTLNGAVYTESDFKYLADTAKAGIKVEDKNKDTAHELTVRVIKELTDGTTDDTGAMADQKEGERSFSDNAKYTIRYKVVDLAGNEVTTSNRFVIDRSKPVNDIKIREPQNAAKFGTFKESYNNKETGVSYDYARYFNHDVTMDLTVQEFNLTEILVTDGGTTVKRYDRESGGFTAGSNGNYSSVYTASSEGVHNIVITAKDASGNVSTTQTVSFVIDKTAPVVSTTLNGNPFSEGDPVRYLVSAGTVAATVSDTNKDEADLSRTVQMTPPGSSASVSTAKVAEGSGDFSTDADYVVSFKAIDRAGNESAVRNVSFRVDKLAPELTISGVENGGTSTKEVSVTYNVHEAFYQDMTAASVKVYKKVDGASETLLRTVDIKGTGLDSSVTESFKDDGEYRFEFDAEDKVGNKAHTGYSFILDATAPTLVLNGVKNYDKTKSDVIMDVLLTENFFKSNTMKVDGSRVDIDGKKNSVSMETPDPTAGKEVKYSHTFKEDGIYDVDVSSKDKAGNQSAQAVHFTIDKTAPEIGDLSRYDGVTLNKFVWDIDENSLVKDLTVCDVTIYLDGVVYDGTATLSDGSHTLKVTAVDELGNESSKEVSFMLDQIAPNIIVSGIEDKQEILEPVTVNISLQIGEDSLDSVTLNGENKVMDGNTASFKVDKAGDYNLVVKAHDKAGNESVLDWNFTYGKKFNWWWIVAIGGGICLLALIILLIRRKSWKQK